MEEIWFKACQHYDVPDDVTKTWYARIQQRLNTVEPTRIYHNWNEMLLPKREQLLHLKPCLVLAAFFQYYHFEGNSNCVKKNCLAFEEFCKDALLEDETSKCLILKLLGDKKIESELTTESYDDDANLLQDLDLVVLAAAPEDYKKYTQLLRLEYTSMNDEQYKMMRLKVLETLLTIPNIFLTPQFQTKHEEAARQNICFEIKELKGCNIADDTPTTSAAARSLPFKKFRDNLHPHKRLRNPAAYKRLALNSVKKTKSSSQLATRKLLRSIKRRELQHNVPPAKRTGIKRRLNFASNNSKFRKTSLQYSTLKESEIVWENEQTLTSGNADSNIHSLDKDAADDDCICIEPQIEQIILDDDTSCNSLRFTTSTSTGTTTADARKNGATKLRTSTPCQKSKNDAPSDTTTAASVEAPSVPLFFKDVSQVPWSETIKSDDTFTDYTKLTTLRERTVKTRRSNRLKKKRLTINNDDKVEDDDTIVVLDDSSIDCFSQKPVSSKCKRFKMSDDSVIFVSESNPNILPNFIPLIDANVPNPIHIPHTPKKPARYSNELFTKSEKKQLTAYNDNAYNPSAGRKTRTQKRMVIVDGSNVAFNHGLNQEFSVRGIQVCVDYFDKMGHEVKVVVPQFRNGKTKSTDQEMLERLHKTGKIVFTPCKNLPGKSSVSYDDRFVLQLACELDAAVVSNDNYRDLINENTAFKKIIENRVVGYTWCNDIFMLPKDPYGKWGPTLHAILNRT